MNLRILVYSNPLTVDKIGKTFQYWRDSGFIYTKQLIGSLPEGWRFYWCIPDKINQTDWFLEANKNIEIVPYPYSTSIHQNRYNFSVKTLSDYFSYVHDIDAVFCNQPEVSANIRVWFLNQRREKPTIFSFYHWIDCDESKTFGQELSGYSLRQIDGAYNSDYNMFHNGYAFELFLKERNKIVKQTRDEENCYFFRPSPQKRDITPFEIPTEKKIILFNHRLNGTTQWKEVVSILDEIYKTRQDFMLWMTDDSKLKEFEFLRSKPYIKIQNLKDGEYGYLMSKAHFSICNHRGYSTWNMSVIDSIANDCLALIPNREVYKDMFENSIRLYGDEFSHDGNLADIVIKALNRDILDNKILARNIVNADKALFVFSDNVTIKFLLEKEIAKSATTKPAKYKNVLDYILENKSCYKSDWVNKFWSFHANSNFQIIRDKLLMENSIQDNTTLSKTLYTTDKEIKGNGLQAQPRLF